MARPKKPLAAQSGDLKTEYVKKRKQAETNASAKAKDELKKESNALLNADAKKIWNEWIAYIEDKDFYGNITVPELVGYCNAWAVNVRAWRKLKRGGLDTKKQNEVMKIIKDSSEEMTRCMNRGGFSASSRISYGEMKVKSETAEIDSKFGI